MKFTSSYAGRLLPIASRKLIILVLEVILLQYFVAVSVNLQCIKGKSTRRSLKMQGNAQQKLIFGGINVTVWICMLDMYM